ncbi:MAG: hypothetical protein IPH04_09685 [Saprospirales bacterium]|nr:hypothetical protein [Saprospirales bacterium]
MRRITTATAKSHRPLCVVHGEVKRVADPAFPMGRSRIECISHVMEMHEGKRSRGADRRVRRNLLSPGEPQHARWRVFGGITSFYDFSITKNVFTMLLVMLVLFLVFRSVARAYATRRGMALRVCRAFGAHRPVHTG